MHPSSAADDKSDVRDAFDAFFLASVKVTLIKHFVIYKKNNNSH